MLVTVHVISSKNAVIRIVGSVIAFRSKLKAFLLIPIHSK